MAVPQVNAERMRAAHTRERRLSVTKSEQREPFVWNTIIGLSVKRIPKNGYPLH